MKVDPQDLSKIHEIVETYMLQTEIIYAVEPLGDGKYKVILQDQAASDDEFDEIIVDINKEEVVRP